MALAGAWNDNLGPLRHMIPDCMSEYPILHETEGCAVGLPVLGGNDACQFPEGNCGREAPSTA